MSARSPRARIFFGAVFGLIAILIYTSCSPSVVSRIGPPKPPKSADCAIEFVEGESQLTGPYRDIGMISLKGCQDPTRSPCSTWMRRAACELGGDAVYPVDEPPLGEERGGAVTVRVMVVSYVASLGPAAHDDVVARSKPCDPPCPEGQSCLYGQCRPSSRCEDSASASGDAAPSVCPD